jgi:serine protease Do
VRGRDVLADVAVVAVDGLELPALRFKPQRTVRVGEKVLAVGSPLNFEWSVTAGIVSAKDRAMSRVTGSGAVFLLQTDASTTHGNSGGPLLATDGRVVGMACSGFDGVALNFAVPSDTVVAVAHELAEHGEVKRSALGLKVARAGFYGAEADQWGQDGGALVLAATPDRPGAAAGVQAGDVILSFDGRIVDEPSDLLLLLDRDAAGRQCELTLARGREAVSLTATPAG